jgi:HK97 family phage prohead protease
MSLMPTFVINDEAKYNSYGFKVRNAGIDLVRFMANPVMLNDHWNSTSMVLGRWENIRIEGTQLLADSKFDIEDDEAKRIAGKVDRGFVKSCSMGITFNRAYMTQTPDGNYELTKCELMEVSIVAVPSNANAVTLFTEAGEKMQEAAIQLSLNMIKTAFNNNTNMEKFELSASALTALGLQHSGDANAVSRAIEKLKADLDAEKTAHDSLKKKMDDEAALQAKVLIDGAITAGKLTEADRADYEALAKGNMALASKTIGMLPGKQSLAATVNNTGAGGEAIKTADDFEKLPLDKQLAFKAENPDAYKKLFA